MTYLMRLIQINFGIITPEKDEPSGNNTYSAKHLCLLMLYDLNYITLWSYLDDRVKFSHSPTLHYAFSSWRERENNAKNNKLPLGKQICFTIVCGSAKSHKYGDIEFKHLLFEFCNRLFRRTYWRQGNLTQSFVTMAKFPARCCISSRVIFKKIRKAV